MNRGMAHWAFHNLKWASIMPVLSCRVVKLFGFEQRWNPSRFPIYMNISIYRWSHDPIFLFSVFTPSPYWGWAYSAWGWASIWAFVFAWDKRPRASTWSLKGLVSRLIYAGYSYISVQWRRFLNQLFGHYPFFFFTLLYLPLLGINLISK
jgi:hypothetical protein